MAPQPGALTPLSLGPHRQRGEIDSAPPHRVVEAVAGRGSIARQSIPGHRRELGDVVRCPGPQGPRHGGLRGTAGPPTGPWHRPIGPPSAMVRRHRLGPTAYPAHGLEQWLSGAIADRFL